MALPNILRGLAPVFVCGGVGFLVREKGKHIGDLSRDDHQILPQRFHAEENKNLHLRRNFEKEL
jgi:hypothetical protein